MAQQSREDNGVPLTSGGRQASDTPAAAEAWWYHPIPGRRVAAYHAGRLVNQLNFHLPESFLLGRQADQMVEAVFNKLIEASYHLLATAPTEIETEMRRIRKDWVDMSQSEALGEELCEAACDLHGYETGTEEEVCERVIVTRAQPLVEDTRSAFTHHLDSEEATAFELGELVDQGVRPRDVQHSMCRPPQWDPNIRKGVRKWGLADCEAPRTRDLANHMPKAGELRPDGTWPLKLPILCERAGVPSATTPESFGALKQASAEQIVSLVGKVDTGIRRRLAEIDADGRARDGLHSMEAPTKSEGNETTAVPRDGLRSGGQTSRSPADAMTSRKFQTLRKTKDRIDPDGKYIGISPPILKIFGEIRIFNRAPKEPILILGKRGTGKSDIAELIHRHSGRKGKFERVSVGQLKGADPRMDRSWLAGTGPASGLSGIPDGGTTGLLETCKGGTVFFDELAAASVEIQETLLDLAEGKKIWKESGTRGEKAKGSLSYMPDVRLIFATNQDPEVLAEKGKLKLDLLDRIGTRRITVPPLSERGSDILLLTQHFCKPGQDDKKYALTWGFRLALLRYHWPGNVRELKKALRLARDRAEDHNRRLSVDLLQLQEADKLIETVEAMVENEARAEVIKFVKDDLTGWGLSKCSGLQKEMARVLGVSASMISREMNS